MGLVLDIEHSLGLIDDERYSSLNEAEARVEDRSRVREQQRKRIEQQLEDSKPSHVDTEQLRIDMQHASDADIQAVNTNLYLAYQDLYKDELDIDAMKRDYSDQDVFTALDKYNDSKIEQTKELDTRKKLLEHGINPTGDKFTDDLVIGMRQSIYGTIALIDKIVPEDWIDTEEVKTELEVLKSQVNDKDFLSANTLGQISASVASMPVSVQGQVATRLVLAGLSSVDGMAMTLAENPEASNAEIAVGGAIGAVAPSVLEGGFRLLGAGTRGAWNHILKPSAHVAGEVSRSVFTKANSTLEKAIGGRNLKLSLDNLQESMQLTDGDVVQITTDFMNATGAEHTPTKVDNIRALLLSNDSRVADFNQDMVQSYLLKNPDTPDVAQEIATNLLKSTKESLKELRKATGLATNKGKTNWENVAGLIDKGMTRTKKAYNKFQAKLDEVGTVVTNHTAQAHSDREARLVELDNELNTVNEQIFDIKHKHKKRSQATAHKKATYAETIIDDKLRLEREVADLKKEIAERKLVEDETFPLPAEKELAQAELELQKVTDEAQKILKQSSEDSLAKVGDDEVLNGYYYAKEQILKERKHLRELVKGAKSPEGELVKAMEELGLSADLPTGILNRFRTTKSWTATELDVFISDLKKLKRAEGASSLGVKINEAINSLESKLEDAMPMALQKEYKANKRVWRDLVQIRDNGVENLAKQVSKQRMEPKKFIALATKMLGKDETELLSHLAGMLKKSEMVQLERQLFGSMIEPNGTKITESLQNVRKLVPQTKVGERAMQILERIDTVFGDISRRTPAAVATAQRETSGQSSLLGMLKNIFIVRKVVKYLHGLTEEGRVHKSWAKIISDPIHFKGFVNKLESISPYDKDRILQDVERELAKVRAGKNPDDLTKLVPKEYREQAVKYLNSSKTKDALEHITKSATDADTLVKLIRKEVHRAKGAYGVRGDVEQLIIKSLKGCE